MSVLADFATQIHESLSEEVVRSFTPIRYPSKQEKIEDVKAVIFDVYGTLINYWKNEFSDKDTKVAALLEAFDKTINYFDMSSALIDMNDKEPPKKTLYDLYHGLITLDHEKSLSKKIMYPEIRIERVWEMILLMLERHGYNSTDLKLGKIGDVASCFAFYYNFMALGRGFYPNVINALEALKQQNIKLGIVSNAQFYTPVDLTLFVRDQSKNKYDDYLELFDSDLSFYSYEYGVSKPNNMLFQKLYDTLYQLQILPSQTVYVGNDLVTDIKFAREAGMKTAFFIGDDKSAFTHDLEGKEIPDITFSHWDELPSLITFYGDNSENN